MRFTVFTPTFNRGHLLHKLYESLCEQSFKDFEWIIVDDGSVDDTELIVNRMQESCCDFPILYKRKENGGKHKAWNCGVEMASGELFFGCDSDDILTHDALEIVDIIEKSIPKKLKPEFAGVCGLKAYLNSGVEVGLTFIEGRKYLGYLYKDMTHLERNKNKFFGDKAEVLYTSVWKRYRYHEFEGENFLTEATALNRMAEDNLKIRYFNHVIKEIEYLPDGLTANSYEKFKKNPKGWGLYLNQQVKYRQLTGWKKIYKIWEYYDSNIINMSAQDIANNLNMSVAQLKRTILLGRIHKKLKKAQN